MTGEKKKDCTYGKLFEIQFVKPCGRPLHDDEHCIFHSKDIEGKMDEFDDAFWKEFERQKKDEGAQGHLAWYQNHYASFFPEMPSATRNLFIKRFLDFQKFFIKSRLVTLPLYPSTPYPFFL
jgi:hypothetical protein